MKELESYVVYIANSETSYIAKEPSELTVQKGIPDNVLADMDCAVDNYKSGNISLSIDLTDF